MESVSMANNHDVTLRNVDRNVHNALKMYAMLHRVTVGEAYNELIVYAIHNMHKQIKKSDTSLSAAITRNVYNHIDGCGLIPH